jgi:hypothetical protein
MRKASESRWKVKLANNRPEIVSGESGKQKRACQSTARVAEKGKIVRQLSPAAYGRGVAGKTLFRQTIYVKRMMRLAQ